MDQSNSFAAQLLAAFNMEADEHFAAISAGLLELEQKPTFELRKPLIESVYRAFHSLKGASRAVDLREIEAVCQAAESIFFAVKRDDITLSGPMLDQLHRTVDDMRLSLSHANTDVLTGLGDRLKAMLQEAKLGIAASTPPPPARQPAIERPLPSIDRPPAIILSTRRAITSQMPLQRESPQTTHPQAAHEHQTETTSAPEICLPVDAERPKPSPNADHSVASFPVPPDDTRLPDAPSSHTAVPSPIVKDTVSSASGSQETIRIASDRLDKVLLQVEELIVIKQAAADRATQVVNLKNGLADLQSRWMTMASEWRRLAVAAGANALPATFEESLSQTATAIKQLTADAGDLAKQCEGETRQVDSQVEELLHDTKRLLMLPVGTIFQSLPKMVRDIARTLDKEVNIVFHGDGVEIDKRILDRLKDPVMHIVRNAIDHGIEAPSQRERQGKPRAGVLTLAMSQLESGKVELRISDDGAGIDIDRLRAAALKNGTVTPESLADMAPTAVADLIFDSGVTTTEFVTDLSGRGLGMAIVRDALEEIGGTIGLEYSAGRGTTFRLVLPVSHTTVRCILIRVSGRTFMAPVSHIERAFRFTASEVKMIEHSKTVSLDGQVVSLVHMADILGLPQRMPAAGEYRQALVLGSGSQRIAFQVDAVLNEQETVVKQLSHPLIRVRHLYGAAIIGAGEAVPILSVRDILQTAQRGGGAARVSSSAETDSTEDRNRILVVEDSITSRMLLKNILEAVGYRVRVVVDGVDALTALKSEPVDLVISDVEMPRMDGFTLTENLRKDRQYAEIPVILVTSLESREHRERGVNVGANAYIVKSNFDQGNLLQTIQALI